MQLFEKVVSAKNSECPWCFAPFSFTGMDSALDPNVDGDTGLKRCTSCFSLFKYRYEVHVERLEGRKEKWLRRWYRFKAFVIRIAKRVWKEIYDFTGRAKSFIQRRIHYNR